MSDAGLSQTYNARHMRRWRATHKEEFRAAKARYREKHRAKYNADQRKKYFRIKHGLTLEELAQLSEQQDHKCAICRVNKPIHIDHDHTKSGREAIRGILCFRCNVTLGKVEDSKELLLAMIEYLGKAPVFASDITRVLEGK